MKILIQRHGIVIKSVPIHGERASIGSSAESDVVIDDPYLAGHVADIVKQADGWHLIDSAKSLEGITREGQRIDDELVVPGQTYSVGGFELVPQLEGDEAVSQAKHIARKTGEAVIPGTVAGNTPVVLPTIAEGIAIPRTMMDTELPPREPREIPKTMFETPMPAAVNRQASPARPLVSPSPPPPVARSAAAAVPAKRGARRVVILAVAFGLGLLLLLVVILGGGDKKKRIASKPKVTRTAASSTSTVAPVTTAPTPSAPLSLAALDYDAALTSWEKDLGIGAADPAIRARYADLALEVGRIHAANGSSQAARYFSNVVKYGTADTPAVAEAKRRLGQ